MLKKDSPVDCASGTMSTAGKSNQSVTGTTHPLVISVCVCRRGRDIVAKQLSGCRRDVGRSIADGCLCRSGCGIVTKWRSEWHCGHILLLVFCYS